MVLDAVGGKRWIFQFDIPLARSGRWLVAGCLFMVWVALYISCFLGDWIWMELGWNSGPIGRWSGCGGCTAHALSIWVSL